MEKKLDETTPDPGILWLAIGIGVFSVFASFVLAIYCSNTGDANAASQAIEAPAAASIQAD